VGCKTFSSQKHYAGKPYTWKIWGESGNIMELRKSGNDVSCGRSVDVMMWLWCSSSSWFKQLSQLVILQLGILHASSFSHPCASVTKQYNLVPVKGQLPCDWGVQTELWSVCGWQVKLCDPIVPPGRVWLLIAVLRDSLLGLSLLSCVTACCVVERFDLTIILIHIFGLKSWFNFVLNLTVVDAAGH